MFRYGAQRKKKNIKREEFREIPLYVFNDFGTLYNIIVHDGRLWQHIPDFASFDREKWKELVREAYKEALDYDIATGFQIKEKKSQKKKEFLERQQQIKQVA